MKLNVGVPNSMHVAAMVQPWEYKLTGADIGEAMKVADELGYNKCMLGEHFIVPQSHIELSGDHYFHTTVALGEIGGQTDRKSVVSGKSVYVRLYPGGRRMVKKKKRSGIIQSLNN